MKIAITGTMGGGKSSVSRYLIEKGYPVFDTDKMVHTYYEKQGRLEAQVIALMGEDILDEEGTIDRQKMAAKVFNDYEMLTRLEALVFPEVSKHVNELYERYDGLVFFEVPMLFESGMADNFDVIIMVSAPHDLRIQRLIRRGMDMAEIERRSKRHFDESIKIKKSDYFINNDGDVLALNGKIESVIKHLEGMR